MNDDGLYRSLDRADPLPGIERWRVSIAPGAEWPSGPGEWAGALVVIEQGSLEIECVAGTSERFSCGDLLALGWLPIRTLRNRGTQDVQLLAVRRTSRDEHHESPPTIRALTSPPKEVHE